jgi:hypothetical protein
MSVLSIASVFGTWHQPICTIVTTPEKQMNNLLNSAKRIIATTARPPECASPSCGALKNQVVKNPSAEHKHLILRWRFAYNPSYAQAYPPRLGIASALVQYVWTAEPMV